MISFGTVSPHIPVRFGASALSATVSAEELPPEVQQFFAANPEKKRMLHKGDVYARSQEAGKFLKEPAIEHSRS